MGSAPIWVRHFPSKGAFANESANTNSSLCTKLRGCAWPTLAPSWHSSLKDLLFRDHEKRRGWAHKWEKHKKLPPPDTKASSPNPGLLKNLFLDTVPIPAKTNSRHVDLLPWVFVTLYSSGCVILDSGCEAPASLCLVCLWAVGGGQVSPSSRAVSDSDF